MFQSVMSTELEEIVIVEGMSSPSGSHLIELFETDFTNEWFFALLHKTALQKLSALFFTVCENT